MKEGKHALHQLLVAIELIEHLFAAEKGGRADGCWSRSLRPRSSAL